MKNINICISISLGIIICLTLLHSCTTETDLTSIREVKYSSDISNIIASNCGSSNCHGSNASQSSLIGYDAMMNYGDIKAGSARKSKLYKVITGKGLNGVSNKMPPKGNGDISDHEISLIYVWIEQGAKNN